MIYPSPIRMITDQMKTEMLEEQDKTIMRAVQKVGVYIDKDALIMALNADRRRYEEAYRKGYADCQEKYRHLIELTEEAPTDDR